MQTSTVKRKALSIAEAMEVLGVSRATIRRSIDSGDIRAVKLCNRILIPVSELERILGCALELDELPSTTPQHGTDESTASEAAS